MRKKLATIAFALLLCTAIFIVFWDAKLFEVYPYFDPPRMVYLPIFSVLLALLSVLAFPNKSKRISRIRFLGILVLALILSFLFIERSDLEKIDYAFSTQVKSFYHQAKKERASWTVHTFVVDSDTIYFSQNSRREKIHEGEFELYKSNLTNHYYVRPKTAK